MKNTLVSAEKLFRYGIGALRSAGELHLGIIWRGHAWTAKMLARRLAYLHSMAVAERLRGSK